MKRTSAILLTLALALAALCPCVPAESSMYGVVPLSGADEAARANIDRAIRAVNGYYLPYGSAFSFESAAGPCTAEGGYLTAENGAGEAIPGGGTERVATALYLALRGADSGIQYEDLSFYGDAFVGDYVSRGSQAVAVDGEAGLDFSFFNYATDLSVQLYADEDYIYCLITPSNSAENWNTGNELVGRVSLKITGSDALMNNVGLACDSVYDVALGPDGVFSFNETVGPRTAEYGYLSAPDGTGMDAPGGGADAVASAIYLAVRELGCVDVLEKSAYGSRYSQSYVSNPQEAVYTDAAGGVDFSFQYTGHNFLALYTWLEGHDLICEVYETSNW